MQGSLGGGQDPEEAQVLSLSTSEGEQTDARIRPCRRSWGATATALASAAAVAVTIGLYCSRASVTSSGPRRKLPEASVEIGDLFHVPVREFEEVMLDEEILDKHSDQLIVLKRGAAERSRGNATYSLLDRVSGRRLSSACSSQKRRLQAISEQNLAQSSEDSLFPPRMSSIASPGENCGDSAKGVHEQCSKYNSWKSFQAVAKQAGKPFKIMGHPHFHDIGQGDLGTCYFLSAIASIAYTDPQVIDKMFTDRHKWAQNIYTTRWFVNGETISVVVDNQIPAAAYQPYFVQPSSTGEWWPVILEKAWAKMAGSFKNAEAGMWASAVMGMTGGAPIKRYDHKETTVAALMQVMSEATHSHWPMGAGTSDNCVKYGLSPSHSYSIFKVYKMAGHGTVVEVYNPWHLDNYKGRVPNKHRSDGVFTMTAHEYHDAFRSTGISHVVSANKITTKEIQKESSKTTAWTFHMPSSGEFSVSVRWPLKRFLEHCRFEAPRVSLAVRKHGSGETFTGQQVNHGYAMTTAKVTAGQGHYTAVVAVSFPDSNEVHEAHLVVYSPVHVTIQPSSVNAVEMLTGMLAPAKDGKACSTVFVPKYGNFVLKTSKLVKGIATYWAPNEREFLYWMPTTRQWYASTSKYFSKVQQGEIWSFQKLSAHEMSCGCRDDPKGVSGFSNVFCGDVRNGAAKYSNVMCRDTEHSKLVLQFCPQTCHASFCSGSSPAPAPPPPAPSSGGGKCEDKSPPGIKLNGATVHHCSQLRDHCQASDIVEDKCCETCAEHAEAGGVSNERGCKDHVPTNIVDEHGNAFSCSELKDFCHNDPDGFIADRCCATCGEADGLQR